jgi:AAA15 family ATPase/GTPase
VNSLLASYVKAVNGNLQIIEITENIVQKEKYGQFEETIDKLYEFLHIFKSDLRSIEIDKKEKHDLWVCDLVMAYDSYKIHVEYESTGIKKLIRLFAYLNDMVQGGIVFIDEFDSNLHDVYLCALLEYLMEYGAGQLCFTTHNVGPMDVLKQRKKSIDFLSEDHKIYSWTKSGNYSPSKLYKNGMIEGSPFNVDSIDFIGIFGSGEEDE